MMPAELVKELIKCAKCSVADPGCLFRSWRKNFFVTIIFTKLKILSFPTGKEKFASVYKEGSNFTQKTVNKLSDMG
jgi:hypothetical protein